MIPNGKYISNWQNYIYEKLNVKMFENKLAGKSTVFCIKDNARVLVINLIKDIRLEINNGQFVSNLALRFVKVSGGLPKELENSLYIDFEELRKYYDALYVTQDFISLVDWILHEYNRRVMSDQQDFDEKISPEYLIKAIMFENWNVDSILLLNKDCIEVLEIIKE